MDNNKAQNSKKSDQNWKEELTEEQYRVMREGGTEAPFSGELLNNKESGVYRCAACGSELFSSDTKFDSGTGWPSFDRVMSNENVTTHEDNSLGMHRVSVNCKNCGAHLGHVFPDGPTDTGERYCINSVCLAFDPAQKNDHSKDDKNK
jgi:methionine-R-sulfoxide reductase